MNSKHLAAAIFTLVFLCFGNGTMAKDLVDGMTGDSVVTVNVNEADASALADALVGVGISRAQAIVDYREQYGRFYSAEELTAVKGIGQATVERNMSRITTE
jgi:competence protein ComEA